MSAPQISVIIPARDAESTLPRSLASIAQQEGVDAEVIVVDDGSLDGTAGIAAKHGAQVIRQGRLGPGAARHTGAGVARAPLLAFTDADCFPTREWLATGISALGQADLIQGRVIPDPTAERGPYDHTIWVTNESGLYETANLFVTADLYRRIGGFEDWLEVPNDKMLGEDVWFGWQARRSGATTAFEHSALVHHAVVPRSWRDYVAERRRLVFFPALVRKMPELRRSFLKAGVFVTPRSAATALAVSGIVCALGGRTLNSPGTRYLSAAAIPYLAQAMPRGTQLHASGVRRAAVEVIADAISLWALIRGSIRARTLVL